MDNLHYARQCEHKIPYATEEAANCEAKRMHKRYKKRFNSYQCFYCQKFHVGSQRSAEAGIRRFLRSSPAQTDELGGMAPVDAGE